MSAARAGARAWRRRAGRRRSGARRDLPKSSGASTCELFAVARGRRRGERGVTPNACSARARAGHASGVTPWSYLLFRTSSAAFGSSSRARIGEERALVLLAALRGLLRVMREVLRLGRAVHSVLDDLVCHLGILRVWEPGSSAAPGRGSVASRAHLRVSSAHLRTSNRDRCPDASIAAGEPRLPPNGACNVVPVQGTCSPAWRPCRCWRARPRRGAAPRWGEAILCFRGGRLAQVHARVGNSARPGSRVCTPAGLRGGQPFLPFPPPRA